MEIFTAWTNKSDGDMNSKENRRLFLEKNNLRNKLDVVTKQVHGNVIVNVSKEYNESIADGMITNNKNLALFIRVADCVPILFHDIKNNVIAAVHAGRESSFKNISSIMISNFISEFSTNVSDIKVYIGPSIGTCCYEVSQDMADKVSEEYGKSYVVGRNINLQKINECQLLKTGILKENINFQNICTKCNNEKYFSYRSSGEKNNFAGVICLS